jgi:hypothetical protein
MRKRLPNPKARKPPHIKAEGVGFRSSELAISSRKLRERGEQAYGN